MFLEITKNQYFTINIIDFGTKGEGIGKIDTFTVFINGGVPGDKLEIKIIKVKKNYGFAKLIKIIKPSPDRVVPKCELSPKCGGCQLQHLDYSAQLRFKEKKIKDNLTRIGGFQDLAINPILDMSEPYHYRNKAQFAVDYKDQQFQTGLYTLRSHEVVDTPSCLIMHPLINQVIKRIRDFVAQTQISIYDEKKQTGLFRYLVVRVGFNTQELMVCLVLNSLEFTYDQELIAVFKDLPQVQSLVLNYNLASGNNVLGTTCKVLQGSPYIQEHMAGLKFKISPLSFFQVNPVQVEKLYQKVLDFAELDGSETVWDLYCGIGTIALYLAAHLVTPSSGKVYGIEIVPDAIKDAQENAKLNKIKNAHFLVGKAEEIFLQESQKKDFQADLVVLNPPRKGCEKVLLEVLTKVKPRKIIYVSCDPATLARDLKILCQDYYTLTHVQPVDMFPQTVHVETVACLTLV